MKRLGFALALGLVFAATVPARADALVLNGSTGALYDGLLDGWPGGPPDGGADFAGNPLGVALRTGQPSGNLEERGVGEFPLAPLAGLGSADIQSATLTFFIDDVIGTFGPGADFDGTAAERLILFGYAGNGTVELADFQNVAGAPLAIVTPGPGITDQTLQQSGPLRFDVDVTARLKALVAGGAAAFGVVWATDDNLTATSLDGKSPPGVPGATAPFITVTTVPRQPPVFTSEALACQRTIGTEAGKFAAAKQKAFTVCFGAVLADVAAAKGTAAAAAKCGSQLDASNPQSKLAKAAARFTAKLAAKCGGVTPADLDHPCDHGAADMASVAECILARHEAGVEQLVRTEYADACTLLRAVGLDGAFPEVCAAP